MSASQDFTPQRHAFGEPNPGPELDLPEAQLNPLLTLERELHLEAGQRRAIAASFAGSGRRETPRLAEHMAWLLIHETDALAAYSLYCAVLATHPERWTLFDWQREQVRVTPFAELRTAILDDLLAEGILDLDDEEDLALVTVSEHHALIAEYRWLGGDAARCDVNEVVAMLDHQSSMAEKVAAVRIIRFANDQRLNEHAMPALLALFRVERHPGLSLRIAGTISYRHSGQINLDLVAFLVRAWHGDGVPAARIALGSVFYVVEGSRTDSFALAQEPQSVLTDALLAEFSAERPPADGAALVPALTRISTDGARPFAAFAATSVLQATRHPSAAGTQFLFDTAKDGQDPAARAFAIRTLGAQPGLLLPLLDHLKALAMAPETDARIRRAAFSALVNAGQSGLPTPITEVIDIFFRYLTEAPFEHFADALHGGDIVAAPEHFLARAEESLDAIGSAAARQRVFSMMAAPFAFGIDPAFQPYWSRITGLMLRALDNPQHGEVHYEIFWNLLHTVEVPRPAAIIFTEGLRQRLHRVDYTERSRGLIEHWLATSSQGGA